MFEIIHENVLKQTNKHTEGRLFSLCQGLRSKWKRQFWHPKL